MAAITTTTTTSKSSLSMICRPDLSASITRAAPPPHLPPAPQPLSPPPQHSPNHLAADLRSLAPLPCATPDPDSTPPPLTTPSLTPPDTATTSHIITSTPLPSDHIDIPLATYHITTVFIITSSPLNSTSYHPLTDYSSPHLHFLATTSTSQCHHLFTTHVTRSPSYQLSLDYHRITKLRPLTTSPLPRLNSRHSDLHHCIELPTLPQVESTNYHHYCFLLTQIC
ncbi:hypothetical protein E2C01_017804 [Portunus trituberculatus]|uniref:Uncharacterized protein n=1 Tax=Portunus trituberculatus TaxID=210409 RepID=A0A5B7DTV3_PORTR|nr:hypothetical protein [Portunus trituberculatus]